jgi:hypothetical protein
VGRLGTLPDGSQYTAAIQTPSIAFRDPRLRVAQPALDRHGLPVVSAGGFAVAFRVNGSSASWAVRCFTRMTEGLEGRYSKVAAFLASRSESHWLHIEYLREGLLVDGRWWPVTIMPWVEGVTLNEWVAAHLNDSDAVRNMAKQFAGVVESLEHAGVAHGDLQHGNVLVGRSDLLKLIDYDGMFVPGLEGEPMPEVGHPHYQHPLRGQAPFGSKLDRFSAAVIWSGLSAVANQPLLWDTYDNGENILFTAKDYADPHASPLFSALHSDARNASMAESIERLLQVSVERLPPLKDVVLGKLPAPQPVVINYGAIAPFPVLDLRRPLALSGRVGQRVTAVGEISGQYRGRTYRGDPYRFITLGGHQLEGLKLVLWSETLARLTRNQMLSLRDGAVVAATGMLSEYEGRPQIVLERPALLEVLTKDRVLDLLGSRWSEAPLASTVAKQLRVGDVIEHDKFGQGVVLSVTKGTAEIRFSAEVKKIHVAMYPIRLVRHAPARPPRPVIRKPAPTPPAGRHLTWPGSPGAVPSGYAQQQADWESLISQAGTSGTRHDGPRRRSKELKGAVGTGPSVPAPAPQSLPFGSLSVPLAVLMAAVAGVGAIVTMSVDLVLAAVLAVGAVVGLLAAGRWSSVW